MVAQTEMTKNAEAPVHERFPVKPGKTYGLMCVVPTRTNVTGTQAERQVQSWPAALSRELLLFLLTLTVLSVIALLFDAPLEEPANPLHPPNPAKAPWYFLGLQELVSYSAFWGGFMAPTLGVPILMLFPYLERKRGGEGVWFHHTRGAANWLFVTAMVLIGSLTLIGTFFRGENWALVVPW